MLRPSEDPRFNDLASGFAMQMKWTPAQKSGQPVVGWTQVRLEPVRP